MIYALFMRRIWSWKNRLVPSLLLLLTLPVTLFVLVGLSLNNIMMNSLSGMPFELWVIPGFIFIISSMGLIPLIYRDFFDLRVHRKVLAHLVLAPYRKRMVIFGYLIVSGIEAIIIGVISIGIFSAISSFPLSVIETLFMMVCLGLYLLLLGNLLISMGLLIDTVTTFSMITFITFIFILFGNGFIIEFGFFPTGIDSFLKWQPISIPFQVFQLFINTNIIDWQMLVYPFVLVLFWVIANTKILKWKLRH